MKREARNTGSRSNRIPPLGLALFGTALFACFAFLPLVRSNRRLVESFGGACAALVLFLLIVGVQAKRSGRVLRYEYRPRPVHYVQLAMHTSIYAYWGWYWREVYHYAPLIVAQIVFVYVFDMLLCWSRRDTWILGFGPVPIVLSTNLFLWFRDDWFYLQFLLVSTGVLCKEFITWSRDGRRAHIFNPSAIALCLFSIGLLATGNTHITWGEEVAVTLGRPPHIYLEIFLVGLVVQALFSVTLVTLSAAAALCLLNLIYTGFTGVYHFVDSNIPIATFLGLHLLVTDPATSPRTNPGKFLFGSMYGAGVFGLYAILDRLGSPTFYDKLLCVPALNLLVQALDRKCVAFSRRLRDSSLRAPRWVPTLSSTRANLVYMSIWIALFFAMWSTGFIGASHPGSDPEFWVRACQEGRRNACQTLVRTLGISCQHGSGRGCVSLAVLLNEGTMAPRDRAEAAKDFGRACDLKVTYACTRLVAMVQQNGEGALQSSCARGDGESCFVLGSLYYAGRGVPQNYARAVSLFGQSCASGWWRGCGGLAECYRSGTGTAVDPEKAIAQFEKACSAGVAPSCFAVANMYRGRNNETLARTRFQQACNFSKHYSISQTAYFRAGVSTDRDPVPAFCSDQTP